MAQQTTVTNAALDRIRQRGYWRTVIRPVVFSSNHIANMQALFPLVEQHVVRFGGRAFPHCESWGATQVGGDWIAQTAPATHYFPEYWRFYQSGQFLDYRGLYEDWRRKQGIAHPWEEGKVLFVKSTLYQLSEMCEFAARLALAKEYAAGEHLHLEILLRGLQNRRLYDPSEEIIFPEGMYALTEEFTFAADLSVIDLIAQPQAIALEIAERLFFTLHWQPSRGLLRDLLGQRST